MDINFLLDYVNVVTLGICLCFGYAFKEAFTKFPNKYIPLMMLASGCVINIVINLSTGITSQCILGGMISGLASTGLYEMLRNIINKEDK